MPRLTGTEGCAKPIVVSDANQPPHGAIVTQDNLAEVAFFQINRLMRDEQLSAELPPVDQVKYVVITIVVLRACRACRTEVNAASLSISSVFIGKGKWRQPNRAVAQHQPVICPWSLNAKARAGTLISAEELTAIQSSHVRRKPR